MVDANNNGKFQAKTVKKGDLIRSADWNDAIKEIERLGNTTSNLNNNDFKGALTIEGALNVKGNVDIGIADRFGIHPRHKVEVTIEGNLTVNGAISGNIDAGNITSGELAVDRIPNLSADKITSGELAVERIPNLSADKITTGTIEGNLTVRNVLEIGDTPFEGNSGGNREWMTKGMKIGWDSYNLFIGLKDEGQNHKDAVIAWGDDADDNLRFIHALSGGDVDGNEVMKLSPNGNVDISGSLIITGRVQATKFVGEGAFVTGMIIMWSGQQSKIPDGWALCDGTKDTPDLRDKFIVGAGRAYNTGNTGGEKSVKLEIEHIPSHNHDNGNYKYLLERRGDGKYTATKTNTDAGEVDIMHSGSIKSVGEGHHHENRPPYYALCFIVKISTKG